MWERSETSLSPVFLSFVLSRIYAKLRSFLSFSVTKRGAVAFLACNETPASIRLFPSGSLHRGLPVFTGLKAESYVVPVQVLCWLIVLLVLSINGYLLVVFFLSQAPQTVAVHVALGLGALAYSSLVVYLALGPDRVAAIFERYVFEETGKLWPTSFRFGFPGTVIVLSI